CRAPRAQAPLPGLSRLREWLAEEHPDPSGRSSTEWQRVSLDLDWVSHPAFFCGLEQVARQLEPSPEGLRFAVSRGVGAGLPIQVDGQWKRGANPREPGAVTLAAKLGPPFEGMSLEPPAQPWLSGRYRFEATRLGRWLVRGASGRVTADGTHLELPDTT